MSLEPCFFIFKTFLTYIPYWFHRFSHFNVKIVPCWSVVKNAPADAGETGLTSGLGTKIPSATGHLGPCAVTTKACAP